MCIYFFKFWIVDFLFSDFLVAKWLLYETYGCYQIGVGSRCWFQKFFFGKNPILKSVVWVKWEFYFLCCMFDCAQPIIVYLYRCDLIIFGYTTYSLTWCSSHEYVVLCVEITCIYRLWSLIGAIWSSNIDHKVNSPRWMCWYIKMYGTQEDRCTGYKCVEGV